MISDYLNKTNTKIPSLAFHSITNCKSKIVLYGGLTISNKLSGDVFILQYNGLSLTKISYEQNKSKFPIPRHSHTSSYDERDNLIYLFGGYCEYEPYFLNQLCIMDISNDKDIKFDFSMDTDRITQRCRHVAFLHGNYLYIYGGYGISKGSRKISKYILYIILIF